MSFLAKLFKRDSANNTATKKASINTADIQAMTQAELLTFIQQDQTDALKAQAISQLDFDQQLLTLAKDNTGKLSFAAAKRLAALLDEQCITLDSITQQLTNTQCLDLTSYCKNAQLLNQVLDQCNDQNDIANIAVNAHSSKTRQAAAQRISDEQLLHDVQKNLKHKDNSAYKIVKSKLDIIRNHSKEQQAIFTKLEETCEHLERLSNTVDEKTLTERFDRYQSHWQSQRPLLNNDNIDNLDTRYSNASQACNKRIDAIKAELAHIEAEQKAIADAKQAYQQLTLQSYKMSAELFLTDTISDVEKNREKFTELKQQWQTHQSAYTANTKQQQAFEQANNVFTTSLDTLKEHGLFVEKIKLFNHAENTEAKNIAYKNLQPFTQLLAQQKHELPEELQAIRASLNEYTQSLALQKAADQDITQHISKLISNAKNANAQGKLRQAYGIRESITRKLEQVSDLPQRISERLENLDEEIAKLQDYRNFATEPKKQALIAAMATLAEKSTLKETDPSDLANQIQKLQNDWKELVYGGKDTQPELWEQFHALAQTAYEPCNKYFEGKADERENNLAQRKKLINELESYLTNYDWGAADWKSVEAILRTAKKQWSDYFPVDRAANKAVEKQFRTVCKSIQEHIDAAYEKAKQAKQAIINEALALNELESHEAIDKVKRLQQKWQQSGRTWHKADNILWKEFRSACDAVFEKKKSETNAFMAELQANLTQAENICTQLETIAQKSGNDILSQNDEIKELSRQYEAIEDFPRKSSHSIQKQFKQALEAIDIAIQGFRKQEKLKAWQQVFAIKSATNELLCLKFNNAATDKLDALTNTISEKKASITQWPSGSKNIIEQLPSSTDIAKNHEALQLLCIRLEILLEKSTPESDKNLRMQYQVNHLKEHMTGATSASSITEQIQQLNLEWLAMPAVEHKIYLQLEERFLASQQ